MQIHLLIASGPAGIECINPLMHMGPVKLDSARFSWKRDISVSTEFQTTLVCVDDSRTDSRFSEPPRTNRETLLSERQINVDIYIYIYTPRVAYPNVLDRCNTRVLNAALIQKFTIIRARRSRARPFTTRIALSS